jgi:cytochrome P450
MEVSNYQTYSLSNLNKEEFRLDPYPFYSRLRAYDPVYWDDELGFWVLTGYADIASVYGDSRFSRAQGLWRGFDRLSKTEQAVATPVYKSFSHTLFYADPPYHTHLRGLVSSKFTPMRVEMLRPYIQARVNELLDTAQDAGRMDAIGILRSASRHGR